MLRFVRALAALVFSLALLSPALAAVTATPALFQAPGVGAQTFIQGTDSAGTYKTIYTGGSNGSKCFALMAESNDNSATHLLTVEIVHGATTIPMMAATIPLSGAATTYGTPLNLMSSTNWPGLPTDSDANPFLYLASGDTLKATFATALTASDQLNFMAVCSDL